MVDIFHIKSIFYQYVFPSTPTTIHSFLFSISWKVWTSSNFLINWNQLLKSNFNFPVLRNASIEKRFFVHSIKCKLENQERLNFKWFCTASDIWNISDVQEKYEIKVNKALVFLFETITKNRPFICNQKTINEYNRGNI